MSEGWNNYHRRFDMNRPRRRSFDAWVADMQALSGKRDVSQEDADVQEVFAQDPRYVELQEGDKLLFRGETYVAGKPISIPSDADLYARAECAEGRWREDHPNDPTDT